MSCKEHLLFPPKSRVLYTYRRGTQKKAHAHIILLSSLGSSSSIAPPLKHHQTSITLTKSINYNRVLLFCDPLNLQTNEISMHYITTIERMAPHSGSTMTRKNTRRNTSMASCSSRSEFDENRFGGPIVFPEDRVRGLNPLVCNCNGGSTSKQQKGGKRSLLAALFRVGRVVAQLRKKNNRKPTVCSKCGTNKTCECFAAELVTCGPCCYGGRAA
jgi:hypothetical protein